MDTITILFELEPESLGGGRKCECGKSDGFKKILNKKIGGFGFACELIICIHCERLYTLQ